MATCQTIIRRALRNLGVLQGGQEPVGPDADDGLERLQSLVLALPGLVLNGRWHEKAIAAAATACEGERLTVTGAVVVTLPATVTWDGRTRPPHDLAKVQILGADVENAGLWLYSATKAAWGQADDLALIDELPFGSEDDAGLAAHLATDWADEYGPTAQVQPRTLALAQIFSRSMRARLKKAERHCHRDRRCGWPADCDY